MTDTSGQLSPRWVYRVDRGETPEHGCMMSYGTRPQSDGDAEYVSKLIEWSTRVGHSHTGPLVVSIWQAGQDEHYRNPVPEHAERFVYQVIPVRSPAVIPEEENPCDH